MKSLEGRSSRRYSAAADGTGRKHLVLPELESDSNSNVCSCVHSSCMPEETQQSKHQKFTRAWQELKFSSARCKPLCRADDLKAK